MCLSLVLLQDAMAKDKLEKETEPELNVKADLADAYLHPIFLSFDEELDEEDERHQKETTEVRVDKHETQSSSPVTELGTPHYQQHEVYNPTSPSSHYASAYEQSSSQYEYHYETHRYEEHGGYRYNN